MPDFEHESIERAASASSVTFAVVLTWPKLANAEFEVVQRICRAGTNIGALVWVVDNDGYKLWSNRGGGPDTARRLSRDDCAFVVSLHFESPRFYDIPSYTALWNPPEFYIGFGYGRTIEQLVTHTGVLTCRSDVADAQAITAYDGLDRVLPGPFPPLFHSVPRPYLKPRQDANSRLFYVGVNWERVTGERGRHHGLLEQLDADDLISIYGPEEILGVAPWRGFETYRGSIPFDGESVVAKINEAGICLALSSVAHQSSGIMSNRLFEALAGGAVVIANPHPLITRYFADLVHVVDDQGEVEDVVARIRTLVMAVRADPAAARARALAGQRRLAEAFSLEDNLLNLAKAHPALVDTVERRMVGDGRHEVTVILDATGATAGEFRPRLERLREQVAVSIDLLVLGAPELSAALTAGGAVRSTRLFELAIGTRDDGKVCTRTGMTGPLFAEALASVETPYFCTMQADDDCFRDHLATLAQKLAENPECPFACSGKLEQQADKHDVVRRRFSGLAFDQMEALAEAAYPRDVGRFLFRRSLIPALPSAVFGLLDTGEYRLLTLWATLQGPLTQTNYATYVRDLDIAEKMPLPFFSDLQQREVIRDTVRGRRDWLTLVSTVRQLRMPPPQMTAPAKFTLGRTYALRKGGDGLPSLRDGFSLPEADGIWMEGPLASLQFEIADSDRPERADLVLVALGRPANADGSVQSCAVTVNGQAAGRITLGPRPAEFRIPLPASTDLHSSIDVSLRLRHADQVLNDAGKLVDDRRLGLRLITLAVWKGTPGEAPMLAPGHGYALHREGDGLRYLAEGFTPSPDDASWAPGPVAALRFRMGAPCERPRLSLVGQGAEKPVRCMVSLDDAPVGEMAFGAMPERQVILLPPLDRGPVYRLSVRPLPGEPEGFGLQEFGIFPAANALRLVRQPRRLFGALRRRLR